LHAPPSFSLSILSIPRTIRKPLFFSPVRQSLPKFTFLMIPPARRFFSCLHDVVDEPLFFFLFFYGLFFFGSRSLRDRILPLGGQFSFDAICPAQRDAFFFFQTFFRFRRGIPPLRTRLAARAFSARLFPPRYRPG